MKSIKKEKREGGQHLFYSNYPSTAVLCTLHVSYSHFSYKDKVIISNTSMRKLGLCNIRIFAQGLVSD